MNTDLCEWAYLWEINGFLGCVWVWVHICMHFRIKMDISQCYKTHADWCHFFLICLQFLLIFGCCDQCHSVNRSTKKSLGRILICIFLLEVHLRRTAAVRPLSTLRIAKNAQPARFAVTFGLLWGTNAFSCQCHGRGWQRRLCPGRHLLSTGDGTPPTISPHPPPPNKARQMISICPLQSGEEVIDTIRQMMSRICQQSLWMTKTAHLLPLPCLPLLT